jgi:YD repeat-containing protein
MLGIVGAEDPRIGQPTKVLLFRDGRRWHFDGGGELVADVAAPSMVIYRRDGGRRIVRIEGWYGGELRADIRLEYDAAGRLAQARGSDGARIAYEYDSTGQLIRASGPRGAVEYGYRDGLVAAIRRDGAREVRFAYDARGALLREERDGERRVEYARVRSRDGAGVLATRKVAGGGEEMVEFDTALRPVRRVGLDGSEIRWRREAGESEAELVSPLGPVRVSRSADAHSAEVRLPAGGVVHATLDLAGRATSVRKGAEVLEEQEWRPDGQRARVRSGEAEARFGYRPDGLLDRIVFTPARATDGASGAWLDLTTDALGRPARIRDGSGYELRVGYDRTGAPASWASARAEVALERDDRGRVRALRTSFGYSEERAYDEASGDLVRTEIARGGARGAIEFERGRPARITELDGSQIRLTHYPADVHRGQVERLRLASGLELAYRYDRLDRVAAIDVGSASRLEYVYDDAGRLIAARQARR